jgi:hypothetical protein
MGRQHVRGGLIHIRQRKTGTTLAIPAHPDLRAALDATPAEHLTFLTTRDGRQFHPDKLHALVQAQVPRGWLARSSVRPWTSEGGVQATG